MKYILALIFTVAACGSPDKVGVCAKHCEVASDCCSPDAVNCPGPYPQNFECSDIGLCKAPQCVVDADCALFSGTTGATFICSTRDGLRGCYNSCATDGDCMSASETCADKTDDGRTICKFMPDCKTNGCLGGFTCLPSGACGCVKDSDCGSSGKSHCVNHACGCTSDTDCQPGLDICSYDPTYRYPASATTGAKSP